MGPLLWLALAWSGTIADYEDGYRDGYCQAIADTSHGWSIDETPTTELGWLCVWSTPAETSHYETCSDIGGQSWSANGRRYCKREYR